MARSHGTIYARPAAKTSYQRRPAPPFSPPDTRALPGHYALVRWVFCALVPAHTFRIRSSRQKQISPQRYMLLQRLRHNGTIQDSFYRRDPLIFLSLTHSMG